MPLRSSLRIDSRLLLILFLAFCAGIFLWWSLLSAARLEVSDLHYQPQGGAETAAVYPLLLPHDGPQGPITVTMHIDTGWLHPHTILVLADDCVDQVEINGQTVQNPQIPYCDYNVGRPLDVGSLLVSGGNNVVIHMRNTGGEASLRIRAAASDPGAWAVDLAFVFALALPCSILLGAKRAKLPAILTVAATLAVFLVHLQYGIGTPYTVRGHDTDAHIDYIRYIAQHGTIPHADDGWEFHQPPLYYGVAAVVMSVAESTGMNEPQALLIVKDFSVFLSLVTVSLLLWISLLLFPKPEQGIRRALFILLSGTLPSLVFVTSRISNDVLYVPLALLTLIACLSLWHGKSVKAWYWVCALFALTFLTKVTALVLFPVIAVCFFRTFPQPKRFLKLGILGTLLVILLCGWLPAMRLLDSKSRDHTLALGNVGMSSGLAVKNTPMNFLTFSPEGMLEKPFNNPWEDQERRQNFWEYLYRSAYFGEFNFGDSMTVYADLLLFLGFLSIPLIALGSFRKPGNDLPLLMLFGFLLLASFLYRAAFGYSANQDFRFISIAAIPLALFAVRGAERLQKEGGAAAWTVLTLAGVLNAVFLIAIAL